MWGFQHQRQRHHPRYARFGPVVHRDVDPGHQHPSRCSGALVLRARPLRHRTVLTMVVDRLPPELRSETARSLQEAVEWRHQL